MGMMIVRHKVRDYGQWRPIFDRHADMQRRAGLINPRVYHSADSNKNEIVVVFDTEDTKKAKYFAASADLASVAGRNSTKFYSPAAPPPAPPPPVGWVGSVMPPPVVSGMSAVTGFRL